MENRRRWYEKIGTTGSDAVHGRRCRICLDVSYPYTIFYLPYFPKRRQRPSALFWLRPPATWGPSLVTSGPSFLHLGPCLAFHGKSGGHKSGFVLSRCSNCMHLPGLIKQARALSCGFLFIFLPFSFSSRLQGKRRQFLQGKNGCTSGLTLTRNCTDLVTA